MRGKNEFFGYSDSRNQFFGNWDFSPDCDQGRILLYEALLAGFSKILAEKLLRLWEADPSAVLAAEHPRSFTDN